MCCSCTSTKPKNVKRGRNSVTRTIKVPYMLNYLFVRASPLDHDTVKFAPGVVGWLGGDYAAAEVSNAVMGDLWERCDAGGCVGSFTVDDARVPYSKDQVLEITAGPFTGLRGTVVDDTGKHVYISFGDRSVEFRASSFVAETVQG